VLVRKGALGKDKGVVTVRISLPALQDRSPDPTWIADHERKGAREMRSPTRKRSWLLVTLAAAALAAAGTGTAATPKKIEGTVGPGFTIGLTMNGKKVTKLKVGTPYRFIISDRSSIHDFHLSGPGIDRVLTSVEFMGSKSFVLRLKKGSYRFQCDPHAAFMHNLFSVS
jgi:plastocyanin